MPKAKKITIVQRRSVIGRRIDQKRTIAALGLRRINHSVEHQDTPQIRGMINKVRHLIEVVEPS